MTGLLIVSDVRLHRDGLKQILDADGRFETLAAAANASEVETALAQTPIDFVLVDFTMTESLTMVRDIVSIKPTVSLIVFGVGDDVREIIDCAEAGAIGYVTRNGSLADLNATIDSANKSELRCTPRIAASLFRRLSALSFEHQGARSNLSARENEVADLIAKGLANKQIARTLGIQLCTVKNHVHNILRKLQVRRRGEVGALIRLSR